MNGNLETQTVDSTQLIFQTQDPDSPDVSDPGSGSGSGLNVPAIAGGVAGGVVAILILILIIFFCLRRRKRTEEFEDNFDPDRLDTARSGGTATRPGAMPDIDLVGAEITPFVYEPDPLPPKDYDPYGQMAQQPGMPVASGEGSGNRRSDPYSWTTGPHSPTIEPYSPTIGPHSPTTGPHSPTIGPHSPITEHGVTGLHNADFRSPSPGPSLGTSGTLPSSKDRDSGSDRARLQVANSGSGEGGSSHRSSAVLQHMDAGRLQHPSIIEEIPPSYYSISPPDRGDAGRG